MKFHMTNLTGILINNKNTRQYLPTGKSRVNIIVDMYEQTKNRVKIQFHMLKFVKHNCIK